MTIQIENEQTIAFDFDYEEVANQVIIGVLDQEECPYEAEVSLTLVDNEEIHRLNKEFREIDRATDVLSFPMTQYPAPADYSILDDSFESFNPESGELMLGDIVISVERAIEQAREYGHSLKREYAFLIAHSMLHLLGYDHMTEEEAKDMEARQERALTTLGITREDV